MVLWDLALFFRHTGIIEGAIKISTSKRTRLEVDFVSQERRFLCSVFEFISRLSLLNLLVVDLLLLSHFPLLRRSHSLALPYQPWLLRRRTFAHHPRSSRPLPPLPPPLERGGVSFLQKNYRKIISTRAWREKKDAVRTMTHWRLK